MLEQYDVLFPEGLPSLEAVRQRIGERSGLPIELKCYAHGCAELENPEFPQPCELVVRADHIAVTMNSYSYLEDVAIAALVDLGGKSPLYLPKYVNTKWRDRRWWQFMPRGSGR